MNVTMPLIKKMKCYFQANIGKNEQGNGVMTEQVMCQHIGRKTCIRGVIQSKT